MIKNKKIMIGFFLFTVLILAGTALYVFNKKNKTELKPVPKGSLYVREIPSYYAKEAKTEESKRFYSKSIHEGQAVHVGAYRIELVVYKRNEKKAIYGVFIDNSQSKPIIPKGTKININLNGIMTPMKVFKNGFLFAIGDIPSLPKNFILNGEINNKSFSTSIEIKEFRKKPISKKQADF